ncbi:MAG: PQQ-binding-like beta-propeller repeat protein [Terriglobia bacterium]
MSARGILVSSILLASTAVLLSAQVSVLQNRYDNFGTSANLQETALKPSAVNVRQFGKLWSYAVDGSVYAQPLYVPSLSISGGVHNVLYVATMDDKLYAFDANHPGAPLWLRNFTDAAAGVTPVPIVDITHSNHLNIVGNVGILATPVIDRARGALYVLVRTKERGRYVQRLHAIDIATGKDDLKPAVIQASIRSSAIDAVHGILRFDPKAGNQRAALAIAKGAVILAWASHEDIQPYHGWIMAYDAATLKQISALCLTPNGGEGGIWQSGRAPVVDRKGNIYYETGNGTWDGRKEFGNSVLRLRFSKHRLKIADYFTPDDYLALNKRDADLGSTGPLLVPGANILICGDKQGRFYLLDKRHLGHEHPGNPGLIQSLAVNGGRILGGPAYWDGPEGPLVYVWSEADFLKAFRFNGRTLDPVIYEKGDIASTGSPGGALTVSADGAKAGTGIVWAMLTAAGSADHGNAPGALRAYNAETLRELWDSEQDPKRDRLGTLVKFVPPVVADGKVYAATYDNAVRVYGLLPPNEQRAPLALRPVAAQSNPSSASPSFRVTKGRQLFQQCAACHEGDNNNRRMGPRLEGLFQAKKLLNGRPVTDENVREFILHGGNGMPAYKGVLSPDEIRDILAYLRTL